MITVNSRSYIKISNLDLRYSSGHGIWGYSSTYISITDNDLSYIGGAIQYDTTRYGNAIEFWDNANNIYVERNRIWEIFDAALTTQGSGTNTKFNHYFRNNVIWNVGYCFEYFNGPTTSATYNIYVENNTCAYSGYGWGSIPQGRPSYGSHIMSWGNEASISNFIIRNNIFYEAMDRGFKLAGGWTEDALANLFLNNNVWYDSSDAPVTPYTPPWQYMIWYCRSYTVGCKGYSMATFSQYQSDTGKDANSIAADPLFIDEANNDYRPVIGSPVCAMSTTGSYVGALPCANPDADGDGMFDSWEIQYFGNLSQGPNDDYDGDGLTNLQEYQKGTDPTKTDTDNDGMPDSWEIQYGLNPNNPADAGYDNDNDGLNNFQEYQLGTKPLIADTDGDGLNDGSDMCPLISTLPVRIGSTYYSLLQSAYNSAYDGSVIQSVQNQFLAFQGDLNINRTISAIFAPGYDCSYTAATGQTKMQGNMRVSAGTLRMSGGSFRISQ